MSLIVSDIIFSNLKKTSTSDIYQLIVYNLHNPVMYRVHSPKPLHLILCLEMFGRTFLFGKLTDEQVKHLLRIAVELSEILLQLTADKEFIVNVALIVFQELFVAFSPYADWYFFFGR